MTGSAPSDQKLREIILDKTETNDRRIKAAHDLVAAHEESQAQVARLTAAVTAEKARLSSIAVAIGAARCSHGRSIIADDCAACDDDADVLRSEIQTLTAERDLAKAQIEDLLLSIGSFADKPSRVLYELSNMAIGVGDTEAAAALRLLAERTHVLHACLRGGDPCAERDRLEYVLDALTRIRTCAHCGEKKPLPYRRDDLGGYVCLTCVETYLNEQKAHAKALQEALERYGSHDGEPPGVLAVCPAKQGLCTCGLDAALKGGVK